MTATETTAPAYAFYEDTLPEWGIASILLAEDEQGDVFYPVRTMCEAIGLVRGRQAGIIREDTRTKSGVRDIDAPPPEASKRCSTFADMRRRSGWPS